MKFKNLVNIFKNNKGKNQRTTTVDDIKGQILKN